MNGPIRERTVAWDDPLATASAARRLNGREFLEAIRDRRIAAPPIALLLGFELGAIGDGEVTFTGAPDESVYNPIGTVHGGYVATLLDSALGCAVHTTLPAGTGYTSIEIKINYLRPVLADGEAITVVGRVTKPGRRVAFAEGEARDAAGRLLATAQSSFLVTPGAAS
jgi:uncharacterized protein (TIGR00369 family)